MVKYLNFKYYLYSLPNYCRPVYSASRPGANGIRGIPTLNRYVKEANIFSLESFAGDHRTMAKITQVDIK